ncbi:phage tail assembly protein [Umezawaea sp. Da 62-37]|uniref:phage tail assembly protein n=1 Tax=Umezawaea sp. Da 62-37 TaxID=3075927 RepID=UPI0028F73AFB|nr:phage tail assembly protein [Umezawaea sp. Da 62-37]WNV90313.1 phage tail assembly protein [Umezawaea sp. Da 62-37]
MSSFSLDDIRAAADRKYGSTDITVGETTVRLLNPLRMPKAQRDKLVNIQKDMEGTDGEGSEVDQVAIFQSALRTVAETSSQAKTLIAAIGDDLGVLAEVFERYTEGQSVGEASPSAA